MKIILTRIFVGLGVIFLILILIGAYFFITDPYNLKPLIFGSPAVHTTPQNTTSTTNSPENISTEDTPSDSPSVSPGFELSLAQKQALVSFGIDPASVPASISTEQEACFTGVLGASRIAEIKAGAVPSALEFFRAKDCI